jgi:hypothetical protein
MGSEPDLQVGDSGEWVTHLQERLQGLALFNGWSDGNYGEDTDAAVRQLHENAGISHEGGVSAQSWQTLLEQEQLAGIGGETGQDDGSADVGGSEIEVGQTSEDGQWWWDGGEWQPAAQEQSAAAQDSGHTAEAGPLSEDGQWRWDGSQWQPVAQEGGGEDEEREFGIDDGIDEPATDEAELLEA